MKKSVLRSLQAVLLISLAFPICAQDSNILYPLPSIEHKLRYEDFKIIRSKAARFPGDEVKRLILLWPDASAFQVKLKKAPAGGELVNNSPRYEIAAYEIQKLFLPESEYVVPPTIGRAMTMAEYVKRDIEIQCLPTFGDSTVFCVLQYWLEKVSNEDIYDKKRFRADSVYARHLGNMNIFSYLIRHNDSNKGNFLISTDPDNPRIFVPDNGLAFEARESRRGHFWRDIQVEKVPKRTIDRLRQIDKSDLEAALETVAQFEFRGHMLVPVEVSRNIDPKKGVRVTSSTVQFGLTSEEIDDIHNRLVALLNKVDSGDLKTF
jgi:hypothetical protein